MKNNLPAYKKLKAQKQKLTGISFYCMPLSLPDVADAYPKMRLIVGNEAHLRRKSMHCFFNSCASPEENISMFIAEDQHRFSTSVNQPDRWNEYKDRGECCEPLKSVKPSP